MSNQQRIERLESLLQRIHRNAPDAARPLDLPERAPDDAAPNPAVLAYKQKLQMQRAKAAASAPVGHRAPPPGMVVKPSPKGGKPVPHTPAQPAVQARPAPQTVAQPQAISPKPAVVQPKPAPAPQPAVAAKPASPLYQPRPATSQTQPSLQPVRPQPASAVVTPQPAFSAVATPRPMSSPVATPKPAAQQELPRQKSRTATLLMGNAAAMGLVPPGQGAPPQAPATQPPPATDPSPAVRPLNPPDEFDEPATIVAQVNLTALAEEVAQARAIDPPSEPTTVVQEVPTDQLQAIRAQAAAHLARAREPEWPPKPSAGGSSRPQVNELFKETIAAPVSQRMAEEMFDDAADHNFEPTAVREVPADLMGDAYKSTHEPVAPRAVMDFKATVAGEVQLPPQAFPEGPSGSVEVAPQPQAPVIAVQQHRVVNIGGGDLPPPPLPPPEPMVARTPSPMEASPVQAPAEVAPPAANPALKPLPSTNLPDRMKSGAATSRTAPVKKKSRVGLWIFLVLLFLILGAVGALAADHYGVIHLPFKVPFNIPWPS